jgi:hypothetical protein
MTLRVGVVGHRPNRLPEDLGPLRVKVRQILETIQRAAKGFEKSQPYSYSDAGLTLRVVSPLAEGVDRLVAGAALALGFELQCPMPFPQAEYEQDFKPPRSSSADSGTEFRALLEEGERIGSVVRFECDGTRDDEAAAYAATGRIVLNQSDVLIAVWDGQAARGRGGTVDMMREAIGYRIPVLWIHSHQPDRWCIVRDPSELREHTDDRPALPQPSTPTTLEELESLVAETLTPPRTEPESIGWLGRLLRARDPYRAYFGEKPRRWSLAILWRVLRDLLGDRKLRFPSLKLPDVRRTIEDPQDPDCPDVNPWLDSALRAHFAWSDGLAVHYADRYRSGFIFAFLAAVVAVALALAPLSRLWRTQHAGDHGSDVLTAVCALGEPIVILMIVIVVGLSIRLRWHERWLDYRLVAELVRQLHFLLPIVGGRPFPQVPAHLSSYGDPERTWMYWHVRAIEREVGLPRVTLSPHYLEQVICHTRWILQSQIKFHEVTHRRCHRIESALHHGGFALFGATFVVCSIHFAPYAGVFGLPALTLPAWLPGEVLGVLCAVLPALGAALAAINNQGEFGRVAKRSRGLGEKMQKLDDRAGELVAADLHSAEVTTLVSEAGRLMVDEVLGWRVVFKDRPPVFPA